MWKKAKAALALNLCAFETRTLDEEQIPPTGAGMTADASSEAASASVASACVSSDSEIFLLRTSAATPTSSCLLRLSKAGSRSHKKTCAICLENMKAGHGALFTGECSHAFHFNCIASNVKHGNCVCPVCRAQWKEIPFLGPPSSEIPHGRVQVNPSNWARDDGTITLLRRLPRAELSSRQHQLSSLFNISEPNVYDDDEPVALLSEPSEHGLAGTIDVLAYPEYSAIPKMASEENFSILIHLKAPSAIVKSFISGNQNARLQPSRAPVDLVTVLDISGSMAGTKLALLKRAMGFVIQNLATTDRLSVIAFSSTARRLFPLRRMTESGRQHALQAVNSLASSGGTNIAEGLRKGAKVIEERKERNSVCSIILLSDGQDTYTVPSGGGGGRNLVDYQSLVPSSVRSNAGHKIPVHAFGFGADHDSFSMHSISETSGGTFSFIESECAIQDAFAQCIGGLLSVMVQELIVEVKCAHPGVHLSSIRSGSYASRVADRVKGSISAGDLYADEERDFLVSVNVPPVSDVDEIVLLRIGCSYRDPLSKEVVNLNDRDVLVRRPETVSNRDTSIEVDRERNRISAADAMAEARAAAERGALSEAVLILEARRVILSESLAGRSDDRLCAALDVELREMQERMESRQRYEESGRAYVLSGLSSHSWQRATARGNSTDSASLLHSYQTPSMVDMLQRSQTLCPSPRNPRPPIRPARSFPSRPDPR